MKNFPIMLCLLLICSGCLGPLPPTKPLLVEEGEIFIYGEPFPQDANRLSFTLAGISAVRSDGSQFPLTLKVSEFKGEDFRRQRFMASGIVPAGEYSGFSFKVGKASLKSEEGDAALLISDKPEEKNFRFEVKKKKAALVSMTLKYKDSVGGGFSFTPAFTMVVPVNPLPTLTGYVSSESTNTVAVFDKRAGKLAKIIETGRSPMGMALDQTQNRAYVAISGDDTVEIVDVMQNEIIARIRLNSGDSPRELALTPDGRTLITVNTGSSTISFTDPISQLELARVTVGTRPLSILLDRTGKKAFVFNNLSNTISVVDVTKRLVSAVVPTESGPVRGQFNKQGDKLLVFHNMSPYLLVIDLASLAVAKKVYVGYGVSALKVNTVTDLTYVGKKDEGKIDVFNPFIYIPSDFIFTDGATCYMTMDQDENNLVVLHPDSRTLQLINLVSKKETVTIDVGEDPYWVTLYGER